jgi:hypothetical protein
MDLKVRRSCSYKNWVSQQTPKDTKPAFRAINADLAFQNSLKASLYAKGFIKDNILHFNFHLAKEASVLRSSFEFEPKH